MCDPVGLERERLHRPDRFHAIAAAGVESCVEIHRRIAVRRDKFQFFPQVGTLGRIGHFHIAEFVSTPTEA